MPITFAGLGVSYHFDLTEALADATTEAARSHSNKIDQHEEGENNSIASSSCGVVSLLECVPTTPWYRLTRRQKRALKNEIRSFNLEAEAHQKRTTRCHEPPKLPLRLSPASRVFFSYEMTRIAFCLDASPTLTSTYGFTGGTDGSCCPMDRLAGMVRTFFTSLVEPVQAPSTTDKSVWKPILAVTVLAVYPRGRSGGYSQNSLLVRDFRVTDKESAELLAERIEEWALSEVETEIAHRLAHGDTEGKTGGRKNDVFASYDAWTMPMYSSSLRDLIDSGDAALSILSSAARPIIVVATDGRSIACDGIIDIVSDTDRVDVPIVVLDVSSPESHTKFMLPQQGRPHNGFHLMNYDPGGAMFPLHLSDDTEALYGICRATDGCFFDSKLLSEAAKTKAGVNGSDSLAADHFFSFNRHTICPNAIQWYTLFSLSPLSPTFHSAWGKLPPTDYIRLKLQSGTRGDSVPKDKGGNEQRRPTSSPATSSLLLYSYKFVFKNFFERNGYKIPCPLHNLLLTSLIPTVKNVSSRNTIPFPSVPETSRFSDHARCANAIVCLLYSIKNQSPGPRLLTFIPASMESFATFVPKACDSSISSVKDWST